VELSEIAVYPLFHFRTPKFKASEGVTPALLLVRRRVERAKELLAGTKFFVSRNSL